MTRDEMNRLLGLVTEMEAEIQSLKNALYLTDEEYDDTVLSGQMSLEKVVEVFANTVRYLDEQLLLRELEVKEDELDNKTKGKTKNS